MELESSDRGDEHHRCGVESRAHALDVEELLGAEISAEAGLGDYIVAELERRRRRQHRITAMGDIGKRPTVDKHRVVLQTLDQIRLQRFFQKHG